MTSFPRISRRAEKARGAARYVKLKHVCLHAAAWALGVEQQFLALLREWLGALMFLLAVSCLLSPVPSLAHEELGAHAHPRSSKWPAVEKAHLAEEPACVACGSMELLNVHHERPFEWFPEFELEPSNLITLCREHHLRLGHAGNWAWANPHARLDAKLFRVESKLPEFEKQPVYDRIKARAVKVKSDWPEETRR